MDEGFYNEWITKGLIDLLIQQGVTYFCCAPGSRSTPLAIAVAEHPLATYFVHFDERGLGFHALGYAKASRRPAAVIVTSGTAVANLLPAIIEAYNERVPMILLTADRPPELQSCGANQTCDQVKIFNNFVRWQIELPCPSSGLSPRYLGTTVAQAVLSATYPNAGPVHINCPFREPLFSKEVTAFPTFRNCAITLPNLSVSNNTIKEWNERISQPTQGLIVCGSDHLPYSESVIQLAEKLNWPIFVDILSPLKTQGPHPHVIEHFDLLLKTKKEMSCDAIIQFGNRLTSKALTEWIGKQSLQFYLHISDHTMRQDPFHFITDRLHTTPQDFCDKILPLTTEKTCFWKKWDELCHEQISHYFDAEQKISEPGIFYAISKWIDENWAIFLANSMPIRDANQFFMLQKCCGPIVANRGVSGIDGNIATAVGIAQGYQKPTLAILGDQTFLHDLNSLAQIANSTHPVILLVINNNGGGIFSFLPVSKRKDVFEKMIVSSHTLTFHHAAELFGIAYFHPKDHEELQGLLKNLTHGKKSCIIEITTQRDENVRIHDQILQKVDKCLNSLSLQEETQLTLL